MNDLIAEAGRHGAYLRPDGTGGLRLTGAKSLPPDLLARLIAAREQIKSAWQSGEILLGDPPKSSDEFFAIYGKKPENVAFMQQHAGRRSVAPSASSGVYLHWCSECGAWGFYGMKTNSLPGSPENWRCAIHDQ